MKYCEHKICIACNIKTCVINQLSQILIVILYSLLIYLFVCVCTCACHSTSVEVRRQLIGFSSLLLCRSWDLNQVIRLGCKLLRLLSYLSGPHAYRSSITPPFTPRTLFLDISIHTCQYSTSYRLTGFHSSRTMSRKALFITLFPSGYTSEFIPVAISWLFLQGLHSAHLLTRLLNCSTFKI